MKNSKVLSLLTAGALVVSSLSGLVLNGNVARAAAVEVVTYTDGSTTIADGKLSITIPSTAVVKGGNAAGQKVQLIAGEEIRASLLTVDAGGAGQTLAVGDGGAVPAVNATVAGNAIEITVDGVGGTGDGTGFKTDAAAGTTITNAVFKAKDVAALNTTGNIIGGELTAGGVLVDNSATGDSDFSYIGVEVAPSVKTADFTTLTASVATFEADATGNGTAWAMGTAGVVAASNGHTEKGFVKVATGGEFYASASNSYLSEGNLKLTVADANGIAVSGVTASVDYSKAAFATRLVNRTRSELLLPVTVTFNDVSKLVEGQRYVLGISADSKITTKAATVNFWVTKGSAGSLKNDAYNDIRFAQAGSTQYTNLGTTDNQWNEFAGYYHGGSFELLSGVEVPTDSLADRMTLNWGIYTTNTTTVAKIDQALSNDRAGAVNAGVNRFYVVAESVDPSVVVASANASAANAYGTVTLAPRGAGATTVNLILYYQTAAQANTGDIGTIVGQTSIPVTIVASPRQTNVYMDGSAAPVQTITLNTTKDSAEVYAEAITGDFTVSKDISFYAPADGYVTISGDDGVGHAKFESNGNGTTLVYAVPASLKARFDESVKYYFSKNPYGTYVNAYAWAAGHNTNAAVGANGIQAIRVITSGFTRKVLFDERTVNARNYVTTAKMVLNETRTFDLYLSDQAYTTGTPAAGNTKVSYALKADGEGATFKKTDDDTFILTAAKDGTTKITATATFYVNNTKVTRDDVLEVIVSGSEEPTPDTPQPGEPVKEDGVTGIVNEDGETVTVTDVAVVSKTITIPETIDGLTVTAIDAQAFKKSSAKTVYVYAPVEIINKGAFKAAKVKKVYFYQPEALKTVGKNAFKKTNAKVVGVGAAFSDDAAKQLTKAGAKSVKNNGTAK